MHSGVASFRGRFGAFRRPGDGVGDVVLRDSQVGQLGAHCIRAADAHGCQHDHYRIASTSTPRVSCSQARSDVYTASPGSLPSARQGSVAEREAQPPRAFLYLTRCLSLAGRKRLERKPEGCEIFPQTPRVDSMASGSMSDYAFGCGLPANLRSRSGALHAEVGVERVLDPFELVSRTTRGGVIWCSRHLRAPTLSRLRHRPR